VLCRGALDRLKQSAKSMFVNVVDRASCAEEISRPQGRSFLDILVSSKITSILLDMGFIFKVPEFVTEVFPWKAYEKLQSPPSFRSIGSIS
jgi:hypothetical protein